MKQKYEKQVFKTSNTEQSLVYNPSNAVKKKKALMHLLYMNTVK